MERFKQSVLNDAAVQLNIRLDYILEGDYFRGTWFISNVVMLHKLEKKNHNFNFLVVYFRSCTFFLFT